MHCRFGFFRIYFGPRSTSKKIIDLTLKISKIKINVVEFDLGVNILAAAIRSAIKYDDYQRSSSDRKELFRNTLACSICKYCNDKKNLLNLLQNEKNLVAFIADVFESSFGCSGLLSCSSQYYLAEKNSGKRNRFNEEKSTLLYFY